MEVAARGSRKPLQATSGKGRRQKPLYRHASCGFLLPGLERTARNPLKLWIWRKKNHLYCGWMRPIIKRLSGGHKMNSGV